LSIFGDVIDKSKTNLLCTLGWVIWVGFDADIVRLTNARIIIIIIISADDVLDRVGLE